ncbi:immunity protein [Capnocytophaga gingivalis]|uniref:immunity protein n=1 Tax=Capnocytophaga gingivalis TaxID=1017 RepID=UPI0028E32850|nr:immunity protein [Capnocytophaga gingivalis]
MMYLNDFSQEYLVDSLDELEVLLRKRFLDEVNFFILTFKENGFPQLSAFVRGNKCVIYYLEEEVQYISKGKASEGIEVFVEDIYGTEVFLSKNKVLTIDEFYRIAQSFFETQVRPDFIEWEKI